MKILLTLLLCTTFAFSQNKAVTQNVTTNRVNNSLTFTDNNRLMIGAGSDPGELVVDNNGQISLVNGNIYGDQGKIALNTFSGLSAPIFNGVDAMISANASSNHAILGRSPYPWDGIGVIGWSSSGSAAVKALQDTNFNSPALTVWRSTKLGTGGGFAQSPALLIGKDDVNYTDIVNSSALKIQNGGNKVLDIKWNGDISSNTGIKFLNDTTFNSLTIFNGNLYITGNTSKYGSSNDFGNNYYYGFNEFTGETTFNGYNSFTSIAMSGTNPFITWNNQNIYYNSIAGFHTSNTSRVNPKYLGSHTSAPAKGTVDTSLDGDTYFNSTDGRMYIQTPNGWKAITAP
jgi:hypothetical protein